MIRLYPKVLAIVLLCTPLFSQSQTMLIDPSSEGGFESTSGWNVDNDGTNKWRVRTNFKCGGSKGAFIGTANNNNNYDTGTSQVSHIYRDVTFPAGETDIRLYFDYKCGGESTYDGLKIYLVPTSTTPVAGTQLGSGQIGSGIYNLQASCTSDSIIIDGSNAGSTMRFVFSWVNDGSGGTTPAILLDNLYLVSDVPSVPTCSDGIQNGTETGVDCGGTCPACPITHVIGTGDLTACSGDLFDTGGSGSNYSSSESYTETYCSDSGNCLDVTFSSFNTESCCDKLKIYDGPNTSSTLIGEYSGSSLPNGGTIGSTTGCLTFEWNSDGSTTNSGWEASIACGTCPTCSDGIQNGSESGVDCGGTCPTACPCEDVTIGSLPYSSSGNNTSGYGDDYSSSDACGSSYMNGDDIVYKYSCASDECIDITLSNTGSYVGLFVMDGCPDGGSTTCVESTTSSGGNPSITGLALTGGTDYYIVISTWPSPQTTAFDIDVVSNGAISAITPGICATNMGTGVVSVASLPYASGAGTTCGEVDDITSGNSVTCGSTSYSADEDQVFVFTPATTGSVTISLTSSTSWTALSLYDGCPMLVSCTTGGGSCIRSEKSSTANKSFTECLTGGVTYYLVLDSWATGDCISYTDLTISAPSGGGAPSNDDPCGATLVAVGATCTYGTFDNSCASTSAVADPGCASFTNRDLWFKAVVPASGNIIFDSQTGTITDGGMAIYSGSCGSLTLIACDDFDSDNGSMPRICRSSVDLGDCSSYSCGGALTPNDTIWIRMWEDGGDNNGTFGLCVYEPPTPTAPANDEPCNATALAVSTTCSFSTYTNECATASAGVPAPGCGSYSGGDVWFKAEVPASGSLAIDANTGVVTNGDMAIYTGTCGSLTLAECDDSDSDNGSMPYIQNTSLTPGDTVWIRFWEYGNDNNGTFDLCVYDPCPSGSPANDDPCNAETLTLDVFASGNNNCSSDLTDPGTPSCWSTGNRNTVWYKVTAPASGQLSIKAITSGLTTTQIALYSGTCGALVEEDCNQNYTACGKTIYGSEIVATGLTSGDDYWIAVDGYLDLTGTFSLIAIDGTGTYPAVPGQDCSVTESIVVCADNITVGNPGYSGTGNLCNFDGTNNCTGGEKNSVWYFVDIATTGDFNFTLIPNDGSNTSCGSETDYDFLMWKITGSGTTTDCNGIEADPGSALVACNYNSDGVTGIAPGGNAPAPIGSCFDAAFEPTVAVTAGEQYLLVVQNYSGSTEGFNIDFTNSGTGVVNYNTPSTLTWSGGVTTDWNNSTNWGSCTQPDCGINAVVIPGPTNQPVLSDSVFVQDLTINPGAILTLTASARLMICGDFTNNGTIICDPNSVITFNNGSTQQELSGGFTGTNKLGTLRIEKTGGSVALGGDTDIGGNFIAANSTSILNTNGYHIKLGGNFNNADNNNTFSNTGTTGVLEFNGSGTQQFYGGGTITLPNIVMNNTGGGVVLNSQMNISGSASFTNGVLQSASSNLINFAGAATSDIGNANSFIDGPVQKAGTAAFTFPTGDNGIWAPIGMSAPSGSGAAAFRAEYFDAAYSDVSSLNSADLNNVSVIEYWQFDRINGTRSTDLTLYWNDGARSGITDLADLVVAHYSGGQWESETQSGGVTGDAPQGTVTGQSMSNFSPVTFGSNSGAVNPLPVELLSFSGQVQKGTNVLKWTTVSEVNCDYFALERSTDGEIYNEIGRVKGHGTSTGTHRYTETDRDPAFGMNYYRLRQVDFDGSTVYSDVVALERELPEITGRVFPNPSAQEVFLEFNTELAEEYWMSVRDVSGREVLRELVQANRGANTVQLPADLLATGLYSVELSQENTGKVLRKQFARQ